MLQIIKFIYLFLLLYGMKEDMSYFKKYVKRAMEGNFKYYEKLWIHFRKLERKLVNFENRIRALERVTKEYRKFIKK